MLRVEGREYLTSVISTVYAHRFGILQHQIRTTVFFSFQVMVSDADFRNVSNSVDITIVLENDEDPIISESSNNQTFIEEGGAIYLFDVMVTITDADNCFDHNLIEEIRVTLLNPVEAEDQLIVNGSVVSGFNYSFRCDQALQGMACYEDFLTNLEYNNTNIEPGSFDIPRRFMIEVILSLGS